MVVWTRNRTLQCHKIFFTIIQVDTYYVNYCIKINLPKFCRVNSIHCSGYIGLFTIFKFLDIDWNWSNSK